MPKQKMENAERNRQGTQLKRERHLSLLAETSRPRNGKHPLKTYLVKHEFCTFQIARMQQKRPAFIFCAPTQVSLEKGYWMEHQHVSSVSDGGPITFLSPGTEGYVNLSKTILVVRAKVTKADGTDLDADEKVGIVNNFLHSQFKQVDVFLKEKQVTQAMGTCAYRAYLETLLNYGPAAKQSQLTASMFYKDTAGKMDVADPNVSSQQC